MPTIQDAPSGVGSLSDWGLGAGASKFEAVATNDGNTSYLYAFSGGRVNSQTFTFPILTGAVDPVTSAQVAMYARKSINGTGGQSLYMVWNGAPEGLNLWGELPLDFTYGGMGTIIAAPTLAAVNGQHGFYMSAAGGPGGGAEIWVTQMFRLVTFTYSAVDSDGFAYLVGSLFAGIVGSGLLFRDMAKVARTVWTKRHVLVEENEYRDVFDVWRGLRHREYFVLGA